MKMAAWIMVLPCYFLTPTLGTHLNTWVKMTVTFACGSGCWLSSRMFMDRSSWVRLHFKVCVVQLAPCSLLPGHLAALQLMDKLCTALGRWQMVLGRVKDREQFNLLPSFHWNWCWRHFKFTFGGGKNWPQWLTQSERIRQELLRLHRCLLSKSQQRRVNLVHAIFDTPGGLQLRAG